MNRLILFLLILLILVDCGTWTYQFRVNRSVFKFEDMLVKDNLKNEIKIDGDTYILWAVRTFGVGVETDIPVYQAGYMKEKDFEKWVELERARIVKDNK